MDNDSEHKVERLYQTEEMLGGSISKTNEVLDKSFAQKNIVSHNFCRKVIFNHFTRCVAS